MAGPWRSIRIQDFQLATWLNENPDLYVVSVTHPPDQSGFVFVLLKELARRLPATEGVHVTPHNDTEPCPPDTCLMCGGPMPCVSSLRDPTERTEETWRVSYGHRFTSPRFNSPGAADAYADQLRNGLRTPEFSDQEKNDGA